MQTALWFKNQDKGSCPKGCYVARQETSKVGFSRLCLSSGDGTPEAVRTGARPGLSWDHSSLGPCSVETLLITFRVSCSPAAPCPAQNTGPLAVQPTLGVRVRVALLPSREVRPPPCQMILGIKRHSPAPRAAWGSLWGCIIFAV